jgi:hypothetical protein
MGRNAASSEAAKAVWGRTESSPPAGWAYFAVAATVFSLSENVSGGFGLEQVQCLGEDVVDLGG